MADQEESEVYLSGTHIRQWKADYEALLAERATLAGQMAELQQKQNAVNTNIQNLANKLRLAIPFAPGLSEWLEDQDFNLSPETTALTDAILKALMQIPPGHQIQPVQIQGLVPRFGYPQQKLQANPNYLYIALRRLVVRGFVEEPMKGTYRLTQPGRTQAQQRR